MQIAVHGGPPSAAPARHLRGAIDQAVANVFLIANAELRSGTRGSPPAALARQVGMYLAHVGCGLTLTEVGRMFARDRTTVAHACGRIEDLREDPLFDRSLDLLEGAVRLLSRSGGAPHRTNGAR